MAKHQQTGADNIAELIKEDIKLNRENNELLHKMHRNGMIGLTVQVLWYVVIIGLPVAIYFYFIEPYYEAFGTNYELFKEGISDVPGLSGLLHLLP